MKHSLYCVAAAMFLMASPALAVIDVSSYPGFDNTCVTDSSAAFIAAEAAAKAGEKINVPAGTYKTVTGLVGNKKLLWDADGATNCAGIAPVKLSSADIVKSNLFGANGSRVIMRNTTTTADDYGMLDLQSTMNHVGGTPGWVYSPLRVNLTVKDGVTNYGWAETLILNNEDSAGEHVVSYHQANKKGVGWTAAGVDEAHDWTGVENPIGGLVGREIDVRGTGADGAGWQNRGARVGLNIVGMRHTSTEGMAEIGYGVWGDCSDYPGAGVGASMTACKFKRFLNLEAPFTYGLDTSLGVQDAAGAAVKMKEGQVVELGRTAGGNAITLKYNQSTNKIEMLNNNVLKASFPM